jgi:hypothetical protein
MLPEKGSTSLAMEGPNDNASSHNFLPTVLYAVPITLFLIFITPVIFGEEYRSQSSSFCSLLYSPVVSYFLGANFFLTTLFSKTGSLCISLVMKDQVPHPYKTCN